MAVFECRDHKCRNHICVRHNARMSAVLNREQGVFNHVCAECEREKEAQKELKK